MCQRCPPATSSARDAKVGAHLGARGVVIKPGLDDAVYFVRRFLRRPKHIASIWPSSRHLAERMFAGLELASGDLVLEYGPGTGSFTAVIEGLREAGIDVDYLGIEQDPGMFAFLERRFPDLDFVLGDAADVIEICQSRGLPRAAAVISGLPMVFLDRRAQESLFAGTAYCLAADGVFRTFSYVHSYPSRSAAELRELMDGCFEDYQLGVPVLRNLPPAFVLSGRHPRRAEFPRSEELVLAPISDQSFRGS